MVDMSKFSESDSRWLKAKDFVGQNLKAVISSVEIVHFDADERNPERNLGGVRFEGKDKGLILNKTNTETLCEAYGPESDDWEGRNVGLSVKDYSKEGFGFGWIVEALDAPEKEFDSEVPF